MPNRRQHMLSRRRTPLLSISRLARSRRRPQSTFLLFGGALLLLTTVIVLGIVCPPEPDVAYARVGPPAEDCQDPRR